MPTVENSDGVLSMRFYGAAEEIIYSIEVSEDLQTWTRRANLLQELDNEGFRKASIPQTADTQFVRLSVSIK